MRRALCVCLAGLFAGACRDPGSNGGSVDCAEACAASGPCTLVTDEPCTFAEPTPWLLFDASVGNSPPAGESELLVVPARLAGRVEPIRVSEGAFDDEHWVTLFPLWSPDGSLLVFDAANGLGGSGIRNRLFAVPFGPGLPGPPKRIEGLPENPGVYVEPFEWDVEGRAFTVLAGEELYVVHRTGNDLTVTFADRADDEIYRASVCAGGEYVVYATWNDSVVLLPADGTSGERREWESAEYDVSADGKHLAITSADEFGEHTLELLPCGEGTSTRLIEGYESSLEAYFMGRGPYLLVEELGSPVGYFDIRAPTSLQLFSRAIFVDTWSEDGSYAVLVVGTGSDLLRFDLATGETEPIATSSGGRRYLGDLLVLEPSSEEEDGTVVSIIDPRTPASPILELEPSEGASVEQIRRDPSGARIAYLESGPEGTSVHIVELATQARITYALPGALDYDLDDFSGDGAGVLVSVGRPRFRLYWLAATADAEAAEPRLVHEAAWGDIYYGQPWQP